MTSLTQAQKCLIISIVLGCCCFSCVAIFGGAAGFFAWLGVGAVAWYFFLVFFVYLTGTNIFWVVRPEQAVQHKNPIMQQVSKVFLTAQNISMFPLPILVCHNETSIFFLSNQGTQSLHHC